MNRSSNRASLAAIAVNLGLFCIVMGIALPGYSAAAGESHAAAPESAKHFATVLRVRGEVAASGGSAGTERKLR